MPIAKMYHFVLHHSSSEFADEFVLFCNVPFKLKKIKTYTYTIISEVLRFFHHKVHGKKIKKPRSVVLGVKTKMVLFILM